VLATVWGATQWTAWRLTYQPELGAPWFWLFGWRIYVPPSFFWWWFSFDAYAPHIFVEGAYIAASGGFAAVAVAIGMSVWRAREAKTAETYASARWANASEVQSAGLLGSDGVVLGKYQRAYLRHQGPEHVLCFAPTRSGKGVGLVVPSLLTWPGSCIVHDIKGGELGPDRRVCCYSIRPIRARPLTIRCSRFAAVSGKCGTFRMSPRCWSIPKAPSSADRIGKKPATVFWSARSCTSSTRSPTRPWRVWRAFYPIRVVRSRPP
jgi:hypothetical protein